MNMQINLIKISLSPISKSRNKRLDICLEGYGVKELIYHCLTRSDNKISIYEFPMDMIGYK